MDVEHETNMNVGGCEQKYENILIYHHRYRNSNPTDVGRWYGALLAFLLALDTTSQTGGIENGGEKYDGY